MDVRGRTGSHQLRYAAGLYWLLNMGQSGEEYQRPLSLNETGAMIWGKLQEGLGTRQIAEYLAEVYEVPVEDTLPDVEEFLEMLSSRGIATAP